MMPVIKPQPLLQQHPIVQQNKESIGLIMMNYSKIRMVKIQDG